MLLGLGGCFSVRTPWSSPPQRDEWRAARSAADRAAADGRYDEADSLLARFAREHGPTPESREALYWRALYRLDPSNPNTSPGEAVHLLDAYLADSAPPRALEATLVRRAALAADSLEKQVTALRAAIDAATGREESGREAGVRDRAERDRGDRSREQELQRLRDELAAARTELASTKEELDRIKKRLATPRP